MEEYPAEIEGKMQRFFGWLSEKDRRRYAAVEAAKLGHGGVEYIARVLACDPMREGVLWTNLSLRELSGRLVVLGTPASRRTIRRLLRKLQVGRRTARKKKTMGHHPDRNAQFENIARLRREYEASGEAVISIDTKKKELLGNFHRAGTTFTAETIETFDHDFGSASQG